MLVLAHQSSLVALLWGYFFRMAVNKALIALSMLFLPQCFCHHLSAMLWQFPGAWSRSGILLAYALRDACLLGYLGVVSHGLHEAILSG
jgi:hypothetical protein